VEQENQVTDGQMFREEMQGVDPLKTSPRSDSKAPRKPTRAGKQEDINPLHGLAGTAPEPMTNPVGAHNASSHRKNGVQTRLLQKLKRGHFPPGDQLDLHHMPMPKGHAMLQDFINDAQNRKLQSVRIIHGKGLRSRAGPVLKKMVRQALCEHPGVLAFTNCKPADGGSGAVDVLLRTS